VFAASEAIVAEQDPKESRKLSLGNRLAVYVAELKAKKDVSVREFITVKAWKIRYDIYNAKTDRVIRRLLIWIKKA